MPDENLTRIQYRFPGLCRLGATVKWRLGLGWMPMHIFEKRLSACKRRYTPARYEQGLDGKQIVIPGEWSDEEAANLIRRADVPLSWGPDREIEKGIWRTAFSPASGLEMKPGDERVVPWPDDDAANR